METQDHTDTEIMPEQHLATRAAWLYHAGGLTQAEVAAELGITGVKAHRLIARATKAGLVRVFVDGPIGGCIAREAELTSRFGLSFCRVVPDVPDGDMVFRAIATGAASFLRGVLERGEHRIIGVGHGRTLAGMVDTLPRLHCAGVQFVSLLGSVPRQASGNSFDVIHRVAAKTGADAWLIPVPLFANNAADRSVLMAQRGVAAAMERAALASLCLVGIGEVAGRAFLPLSGMIEPAETASLAAAGAVGEILGRYVNDEGRLVATDLHDRVIAVSPPAIRKSAIVAVAGGPAKDRAILAVLRSGMLTGLITDEPTAGRLVAMFESRASKNGSETCAPESGISRIV